MSLSKVHFRLTQHPAQGILPAHFTVDIGVSQRVETTTEEALRKALERVYGDIARDFEKLVTLAFDGKEPEGEAGALCERIRASFKGEGRSTSHHAY